MRLEKDLKVSASMTDSTSDLSVLGVFQTVEDVVTELMGRLKIDGLTARRKYGAVWLFVKNRIKLFKNIPWNDDGFKVVGFITSITRATMSFDIALKNAADDICAYARLEICAIDLESGRIRKISTVGVDDTYTTEPPLIDLHFDMADGAPLVEVDRVRVKYTNLDFSKHANNKEYIRFIINTYSMHQMESRRIKEMEVRYINQSFENDELIIKKGSVGNKDYFQVEKDDKPIVKCEITF